MKIVDTNKKLTEQHGGSFLNLLEFNHSCIGAGTGPAESLVWEMHPDTDEFFFVLEGHFKIILLDGEIPFECTASSGSAFVVAKGIWHKPAALVGMQIHTLHTG